MDYEKKYKEALERAKKLTWANPYDTISDMLADVFPELKESEDERIRKNCVYFLELQKEHHAATFAIEECIAWLEKQGEQKLSKDYSSLEITDVVRQALQECEDYSNINPTYYAARVGVTVESLVKEQGEQKPAEWSEEDERHIESILERLDGMCKKGAMFTKTCFAVSEDIDWLESIKDRVQPKQEWSEDDNKIYDEILYFIDKASGGFLDTATKCKTFAKWGRWLKSLRPQKQWKPSEEQIEAFEHFVRSVGESGYASPYENNTKLLYSLLEQLKKLTE